MINEEKFFRMLGLAARMRAVVFGEGAVKDSLKRGDAKLVIVASDASDNTKKKFQNSCEFYSTKLLEISDRFALGKQTGREFAVVLAVTNLGIAENMGGDYNDKNQSI